MKNNKALLTLAFLLASIFSLKGQALPEGYKAAIELQTTGTTNGVIPFWMRSNQFGSVPLTGLSASVLGRFSKDYQPTSHSDKINGNKIFDWGFGLEARANGGRNSNLKMIEAYAKTKAWIFQLKAGRSKDVTGLNGDTLLSSGNFAVSGNALGIPKIELSIPEYYRVPIFDGLFSFKGNFLHGWVGKVQITPGLDSGYKEDKVRYLVGNDHPNTFFHQKSFYGRFGRESWKLKLYGGFNHEVFWGSEKEVFGSRFKLSPIQTFTYVATGRAYGTPDIPRSKIGNHLGSIDIGGEYVFEHLKVMVYRQNFYETGALASLANIRDGLNGISLENLEFDVSDKKFDWKKILFEFFYSKNQAGEPWSKPTASGDEDYYNNYFYLKGWSYRDLGLGNPLITSEQFVKSGQAKYPLDYFVNNRVIALHTGIQSTYNDWDFVAKASYSWNYGTFGTAEIGHTTGQARFPPTGGLFKKVEQLSLYVSAKKTLNNGLILNYCVGMDRGQLLNNSVGGCIGVVKRF